jgi:hypothetical protein
LTIFSSSAMADSKSLMDSGMGFLLDDAAEFAVRQRHAHAIAFALPARRIE